MIIIKRLTFIVVFFMCYNLSAQTTFLPEGSKEYHLLDRLEIKYGKNTDLIFSTLKPFSRKSLVQQAEWIDSVNRLKSIGLTAVDDYNLHSLMMNNSEWVTGSKESFQSKKPILNSFYTTKPNLLEVDVKDFYLVVNPILNLQIGKESGNDQSLFYNKRGLTARGRIANKIGFSTSITDNQERGPGFFTDRVEKYRGLPGAGFYKRFKKGGYDYFEGNGYFTFNVTKYIDVAFGYDKNFIGDGYRSLLLDNAGDNYLFLKLNTKIWKLNYQNIFMELMPQFKKTGDVLLDRKYAAMHFLSVDITKWLNVGVFEGVVFGRKNHFDFMYLNPIIFLRHMEGTAGSPDNMLIGFTAKANVAKSFQFYGQFMLNEFIADEFFKSNGYWANKYGYQLGMKYVDAFGLPNLDLQVETNMVRPFSYSHYDSVSNFTHYNQMLAHPLGANFEEVVGILKYQPIPKVSLDFRAIYYMKGLDLNGENFGGNPFELYTTRTKNYGYYVGEGDKIKVLNANLRLGYELKENLFLEANYLYRKQTAVDPINMFSIGLRWNAPVRNYDY